MSDPKDDSLSKVEYWDSRYASEKDAAAHEWFRTFESLRPFLAAHLPPVKDSPRIIHLGCGLSSLPEDLYRLGYVNQCGVDFSSVAITSMKERCKGHDSLEWHVADVRKMEFGDGSFDCAIDKGTLDAMLNGSLWDPEPDVKQNVTAYVDEVARVLKPGGNWLYITYRQPHFIRPLLTRDTWSLAMETLQEKPGSFEYFAWIMSKHAV